MFFDVDAAEPDLPPPGSGGPPEPCPRRGHPPNGVGSSPAARAAGSLPGDPLPMSRLPRERRQEELVREALRAFGARGYDGTTLEAVAEAAGVRKQTLLYYFPTKEDLFAACVDALIDGLEKSLRRVLGGPDEGLDRVESVIRTLFRLAEHWPEFPLFLREAARR